MVRELGAGALYAGGRDPRRALEHDELGPLFRITASGVEAFTASLATVLDELLSPRPFTARAIERRARTT